MLFICCIFATGCGTITSSVKLRVQPDGTLIVEQSLNVKLDEIAISLAGYDYDEKKEEVFAVAEDFLDSLNYDCNERKTEILSNPKKRKFWRLFSSTYNQDIMQTEDGIYIYRQFPTIYDFLLYNDYDFIYIGCPHCFELIADTEAMASSITTCPHCKKETNGDFEYQLIDRLVDIPFAGDVKVNDKNFTTDYSQETLTVYKDLEDIVNRAGEPLIWSLENLFAAKYPGETKAFTINDADLKFQFITPYGRVHSNGDVKKSKGYYIHTWDIENLDDTIKLYRTVAKTSNWYIFALVTTIGITAVLFTFAFVKKKYYDKSKEKLEKEKSNKKNNNLIDRIK